MTSEEFRTNPLLLRNQFERTGMFEIPLITKNEVSLENLSLVGYDKISSGNGDQVVHFFLDDYKRRDKRYGEFILQEGISCYVSFAGSYLLPKSLQESCCCLE